MNQNISDGLKNTLMYIAKEGPSTRYQMYTKSKDVTRNIAYDSCPELVKREWLKEEIIGKSRAGEDIIKYSLTVLGFLYAIHLGNIRSYRTIIIQWKDLIPLVLGKWSLFSKANVANIAFDKIMVSSMILIRELEEESNDPLFYRKNKCNRMISLKDRFTDIFYTPTRWETHYETYIPWLEVCSRDSEIAEYMRIKLKNMKKGLIQELNRLEEIHYYFRDN